MSETVGIGLDLGTSGVRALAVSTSGHALACASVAFDTLDQRRSPDDLLAAACQVIKQVAKHAKSSRVVLAVAGTSGSLVPVDARGQAVGRISLYSDRCPSRDAANAIARAAPSDAPVHGPNSAAARALALQSDGAQFLSFEPDFIAGTLAGHRTAADVNSGLKTGADPVDLVWPAWMETAGFHPALLPTLTTPGAVIGKVSQNWLGALGLPKGTEIVAGTTDGCAAALAVGIGTPGDAVVSLGSTLVIKMLVESPITDPQRGIYTHRVGDRWLAGGASNAGGAVLRHFFTDEEMATLARRIDPDRPTSLRYVPLLSSGERFPMCDPYLMPKFEPRPNDDAVFFQGVVESLVRFEYRGLRAIAELSGTELTQIFTIGGGTKNQAWMAVRDAQLPWPVRQAAQSEAAYGAALLALGQFSGGPQAMLRDKPSSPIEKGGPQARLLKT